MRRLPIIFVDLKALSLPVSVSGASLVLAALVGVCSSLFPGWTAARRPIAEALRFTP